MRVSIDADELVRSIERGGISELLRALAHREEELAGLENANESELRRLDEACDKLRSENVELREENAELGAALDALRNECSRLRDERTEQYLDGASCDVQQLRKENEALRMLARFPLNDEERRLAATPPDQNGLNGGKIPAIKSLRARTCLGLKEAKDVVDTYCEFRK